MCSRGVGRRVGRSAHGATCMLDSVVVRRCHGDDLCRLSDQMCSAEIRRAGGRGGRSSLAFAWPGGRAAVAVEGRGHCCDLQKN